MGAKTRTNQPVSGVVDEVNKAIESGDIVVDDKVEDLTLDDDFSLRFEWNETSYEPPVLDTNDISFIRSGNLLILNFLVSYSLRNHDTSLLTIKIASSQHSPKGKSYSVNVGTLQITKQTIDHSYSSSTYYLEKDEGYWEDEDLWVTFVVKNNVPVEIDERDGETYFSGQVILYLEENIE